MDPDEAEQTLIGRYGRHWMRRVVTAVLKYDFFDFRYDHSYTLRDDELAAGIVRKWVPVTKAKEDFVAEHLFDEQDHWRRIEERQQSNTAKWKAWTAAGNTDPTATGVSSLAEPSSRSAAGAHRRPSSRSKAGSSARTSVE